MDTADIIEALHESVDDCPRCKVCDHQDDAIRAAIETALAEHEKRVRAKVAEELHADAAAHRRLVARKPTEHDEARLARATCLDDAAARISRTKPAPAQTTAAHTARAEDERGR